MEMIEVMVLQVLLVKSLHTTPFNSIMVDETTDHPNVSKLWYICIHWVGEDFKVHEDCLACLQLKPLLLMPSPQSSHRAASFACGLKYFFC